MTLRSLRATSRGETSHDERPFRSMSSQSLNLSLTHTRNHQRIRANPRLSLSTPNLLERQRWKGREVTGAKVSSKPARNSREPRPKSFPRSARHGPALKTATAVAILSAAGECHEQVAVILYSNKYKGLCLNKYKGNTAGGAASLAERSKTTKYRELESRLLIQPVAIETLGPFGQSTEFFLRDLGKRIEVESGDERATEILLQRLSVEIQRGNAAAVNGTFPTCDGLPGIG